MAGGGDALQKRTGVWWDLNTCPVPAGFEPRRVLGCIESLLNKEMGYRSQVHVHAFGNLEYMSRALLEEISSSGIVVIHAPCGGRDLRCLLHEWSEQDPPPGTVMLISGDYTMASPRYFRLTGFNAYCAYPQAHRPVTLDDPPDLNVILKEFVWETLLNDNLSTCDEVMIDDKPLFICEVCDDTSELAAEFINHFKSEDHIESLFGMVPQDDTYTGVPLHFCKLCNYPGYDEYNMFLHNQSEEHNRKLTESKKRNSQEYLFNERNKKQSLERGKQEEVS